MVNCIHGRGNESHAERTDAKMSENEKTALEAAREALELKADETNKSRSGKGTRVKVGSTRGKNPQPIMFEAFDLSQPATLPVDTDEFLTLTGTKDAKLVLSYLIDGYNDAMYTAASDPIAEYVEASWSEELQRAFRNTVRNYATGASVSIEDAVALIKPGIIAAEAKKAAEAPKQ